MRFLPPALSLLFVLLGAFTAAAEDGKGPTPAPRVLTPQGAQPISRDAARRSEPATVVIEDTSSTPAAVPAKPTPRVNRPAATPEVPAAPAAPAASPAGEEGPLVEAARLKGIQPGVSTMAQVRAAWGEPQKIDRYDRHIEHRHRLDPFEQVIVAYQQDVVTAIVVHLQAPLKVEAVTNQLSLQDLQAALVYDPSGAVMGEAFPERGVLFSFKPGMPERLVVQIVLEPIYPQPFALRAESRLATQWTAGLKDAEQAIKLEPRFARAHWLKAQLLAAAGRTSDGLQSAEEAVRLDSADVEYRLTRARLYHAMGETARAANEVKAALGTPAVSPLVKARGLCLLADLVASSPQRDYRSAVQFRQEAMTLAESLLTAGGTAAASRDVLLDAQLGTAHDIAWGPWHRKPEVVPKWLDEAKTTADQDKPAAEAARQRQLKIAHAALAALAGMQGEIDPAPWTELLEAATTEALSATDDPLRRSQLQWELALSCYNAMQIHHGRGESQTALRAGEKATEALKQCAAQRGQTAEHKLLLGRVYFRSGAVHAVLKGSHSQAVTWYDKAMPLLKDNSAVAALDAGQRGESLVSMAVSYWEVGQRNKALELTTQGLQAMQQAVSQGAMQESALSVPYNNLAQMHRHLGDAQAAGKYAQMASRSQGTLK